MIMSSSSPATSSTSKQSYVNVSLKVDDHVLLLAGNLLHLLLLLSKAVRDGVADSSHRGRVAGRNNALVTIKCAGKLLSFPRREVKRFAAAALLASRGTFCSRLASLVLWPFPHLPA